MVGLPVAPSDGGTFQLSPSTARAVTLPEGNELAVIDPFGKQVADLIAFRADDIEEWPSSGRILDCGRTFRITDGHSLLSTRSAPMLEIVSDNVGRHDVLFVPCSREMFVREYGVEDHPNCLEASAAAPRRYSITADRIPTPFNIFMNVDVDPDTGALEIREPLSGPGSRIVFRARMNLIVAVSACSAETTNAGELGPIVIAL
jgi:uncharacterized protein YcgI (DUF1989 family)